jgi:hypothetical protein
MFLVAGKQQEQFEWKQNLMNARGHLAMCSVNKSESVFQYYSNLVCASWIVSSNLILCIQFFRIAVDIFYWLMQTSWPYRLSNSNILRTRNVVKPRTGFTSRHQVQRKLPSIFCDYGGMEIKHTWPLSLFTAETRTPAPNPPWFHIQTNKQEKFDLNPDDA